MTRKEKLASDWIDNFNIPGWDYVHSDIEKAYLAGYAQAKEDVIKAFEDANQYEWEYDIIQNTGEEEV